MHKMYIIISILMVFFFQCGENITDMSTNDLIEFESVWQYLKTYSIYQDECLSGTGENCWKRLGDNPFDYDSPSAMMESLFDTLYGVNYTRYDQSIGTTALIESGTNQTGRYVDFFRLTPLTAMIKIREFATELTYRQFQEVIPNLSAGYKHCIIDVRGNPGGDLEELDSILELILPANVQYILARERKYDSLTMQYKTIDYHPLVTSRDSNTHLSGKKFIVLMDSKTASAAEILVAALKDCKGAVLFGEPSYGKAIGQIRLNRRGRLGLQITFLKLKGISFGTYQNIGIQPDSLISPLPDDDRTTLLRVVRMVEPNVSNSSISFPEKLSKVVFKAASPAGYLNVFED